jgi:hypothetical protein
MILILSLFTLENYSWKQTDNGDYENIAGDRPSDPLAVLIL